jgi:hypothetical protein
VAVCLGGLSGGRGRKRGNSAGPCSPGSQQVAINRTHPPPYTNSIRNQSPHGGAGEGPGGKLPPLLLERQDNRVRFTPAAQAAVAAQADPALRSAADAALEVRVRTWGADMLPPLFFSSKASRCIAGSWLLTMSIQALGGTCFKQRLLMRDVSATPVFPCPQPDQHTCPPSPPPTPSPYHRRLRCAATVPTVAAPQEPRWSLQGARCTAGGTSRALPSTPAWRPSRQPSWTQCWMACQTTRRW